ncbi:thiamine phosphate synthase [uncultured Massilia sp.]|uniref:thiamine phosphate synthase n=1 Tax=uncultured Massilia sp. TaxID=169973 RepID=UPI0025F41BBD|nr:thiamine phosphate synthase [uncultured Massilia sp.]
MRGLYLVTPDWDDTDRLLDATDQALRGGAALVQYRHKHAGPALRREQAGALLRLCRRRGRPLVINDHVALCLELDADGVHVGATDAPLAAARAALGPDKIVGASCYGDFALAQAAADARASYVAFGGFYPSLVKQYAVTTPPGIVALARERLALPVVVIGGMTAQNARVLVENGADMVAAISSVYRADDPQAAARELAALF